MWKFSKIRQGRNYEVKGHPIAPVYDQKMPFFDVGDVGFLVPFTRKATMRLIFGALIKLVL